MRSTVLSAGALALVSLLAGVAVADVPPQARMCDPLIAICFLPDRVRFDVLPASVATAKGLGRAPLWVFAERPAGEATLFVVAGLEQVRGDCDDGVPESSCPSTIQPGLGAVVRVEGGRAEVIGSPDVLLVGPAPEGEALAPALVEGLWCDAAKRYVKAFGGPKAFAKAAAAQDVELQKQPSAFVDCLRQEGALPVKSKGARAGRRGTRTQVGR